MDKYLIRQIKDQFMKLNSDTISDWQNIKKNFDASILKNKQKKNTYSAPPIYVSFHYFRKYASPDQKTLFSMHTSAKNLYVSYITKEQEFNVDAYSYQPKTKEYNLNGCYKYITSSFEVDFFDVMKKKENHALNTWVDNHLSPVQALTMISEPQSRPQLRVVKKDAEKVHQEPLPDRLNQTLEDQLLKIIDSVHDIQKYIEYHGSDIDHTNYQDTINHILAHFNYYTHSALFKKLTITCEDYFLRYTDINDKKTYDFSPEFIPPTPTPPIPSLINYVLLELNPNHDYNTDSSRYLMLAQSPRNAQENLIEIYNISNNTQETLRNITKLQ